MNVNNAYNTNNIIGLIESYGLRADSQITVRRSELLNQLSILTRRGEESVDRIQKIHDIMEKYSKKDTNILVLRVLVYEMLDIYDCSRTMDLEQFKQILSRNRAKEDLRKTIRIRFAGAQEVELSFAIAGREYPLSKGASYRIGRENNNAIRIELGSVSRNHCELTVRADGEVYIRDLGSTNGTYINNDKMKENDSRRLIGNEMIAIGGVIGRLKKQRESAE